ncbi:MAG: hypothetical protein K8T89_12605 [Planctomycetes bacterium]|nr:hypothetical protein [Planctomycetota bacterium]
MVMIEIRFVDDVVKVRRFGTGDFKRWTEIRPGEVDRLTDRSFDELREIGEGIWGFAETVRPTTYSHELVGA